MNRQNNRYGVHTLTVGIACLMLTLELSLSAIAETVYTHEYFYYTVHDDSVTITGYFGNEKEVTVPNMIAGHPVNTVAAGAFAGTTAEKINLPDTITEMEGGAVDVGAIVDYNSNLPKPVDKVTAEEAPQKPAQTAESKPLEQSMDAPVKPMEENPAFSVEEVVEYELDGDETVELIHSDTSESNHVTPQSETAQQPLPEEGKKPVATKNTPWWGGFAVLAVATIAAAVMLLRRNR